MALPPLLFETIVSPIEQAGEYFIMDSEQLVSRPYHDMQKDNVDEGRRASLSEKLINVRNKVCNNHLTIAKTRLDKDENSSLRGMHEISSKLRYDVKLLDLDRRRHTVEVNKRLQPTKDYSYDDQQLLTTQKRLGVAGPCYYLQKSMRYPVRHSGLQNTVTPTLANARKTLQRYRFELLSSTPGLSNHGSLSRSSSKRQASARTETPSDAGQIHGNRRKSMSAGSSERNNRKWAFLTKSEESNVQVNEETLGKSSPHLSQSTGSLVILPSSSQQKPSGHKVKFAFPKKDKSYAKLDAHVLARSKTFHQGMESKPIRSCYIHEPEDEDPPPRKVDLRVLLFGKTPVPSRPSTQTSSLGKRRRSMATTPGHLTQEMLEKESALIQRKINTFLNKVETWDPTVRFDSDSSSNEEEAPVKYVPQAHVTPFSRHFLSQMADEKKAGEGKKQDNPINLSHSNLERDEHENNEERQGNKEDGEEENAKDLKAKSAVEKWKAVAWRVTKPNLTQEKQLSTEDLILQRMMGIDVSKRQRRKSGVPLHSASRALRHTPTFKMQKVVEDLMSGRTKFQQFEVDNLKKQLESGTDISELETKPTLPKEPSKAPPGGSSFLPDQLSDESDEDEEEKRDDDYGKEDKVTMMTRA